MGRRVRSGGLRRPWGQRATGGAVAGDAGSGDLFSANFESGGSTWSSFVNGDGSVSDSDEEALLGTQSSKITLANNSNTYGIATISGAPDVYHVRFFFNPTSLVMNSGEDFRLMNTFPTGGAGIYVNLARASGNITLQVFPPDGALFGTTVVCAYEEDCWVQVDVYADGSIGGNANVVSAWLRVAGVQKAFATRSNESDFLPLASVRIGGAFSVGGDTSGPLYVDVTDAWSLQHDPS